MDRFSLNPRLGRPAQSGLTIQARERSLFAPVGCCIPELDRVVQACSELQNFALGSLVRPSKGLLGSLLREFDDAHQTARTAALKTLGRLASQSACSPLALRTTVAEFLSAESDLQTTRKEVSLDSDRPLVSRVAFELLSLIGRINDALEPLVLSSAISKTSHEDRRSPLPFHSLLSAPDQRISATHVPEVQERQLLIDRSVAEFQAAVEALRGKVTPSADSSHEEKALGDFMEAAASPLRTLWVTFGPQHALIDRYFDSLHRDLAAHRGGEIDPALTEFCFELAAAKHKGLHSAEAVLQRIGEVVGTFDSALQQPGSSMPDFQTLLGSLEVLGVALSAYSKIGDPEFIGRFREPRSPPYSSMYRQGLSGLRDASARLNQPGLVELALRADRKLAHVFSDSDRDLRLVRALECLGVDQFQAVLVGMGHLRGIRREALTLPAADGSRFQIVRFQGQVTDTGAIHLSKPSPEPEVRAEAAERKDLAREELRAKGTAMGAHDLERVLETPGAEFLTIEDATGKVLGFAYMFVDPEHFPDKEALSAIPSELLPPGRPARPSFIVLAPELREKLGKGVAYKAMLDSLERIAAAAGADYLIAMYNTSPGSRGGPAAMAWGFRPIEAFRTLSYQDDAGAPVSVRYQWMVKELKAPSY